MQEENFEVEEDIKSDNSIKQEYSPLTESDRIMQKEEYFEEDIKSEKV